jgi:hypothetical protein
MSEAYFWSQNKITLYQNTLPYDYTYCLLKNLKAKIPTTKVLSLLLRGS